MATAEAIRHQNRSATEGANSRQTPHTQTRTTAHPRVIPHEDPFGFDFVDLGEADDKPTIQDPEFEGLPPLLPREPSTPEEPQYPERHRQPNSTR